MRRVAFHTLGCKVNQYDTQAMYWKAFRRRAGRYANLTSAPTHMW